MLDDQSGFFRLGYFATAALAGAINALAFTRWRSLSRTEIVLTLSAGFSFAIFVTPWAAHSFLGVKDDNTRTLAALTYLFGSGSNILLPMLIQWITRAFGTGRDRP